MPRPTKKRRSPREFARHFPENGMKLLLEDPANVRDLLGLTPSPLVAGIDFTSLRPGKMTFVQRDYSHLGCDIVYTARFRSPDETKGGRIVVWLLLEHQSEPELPAPLRLLEYDLLIYKFQAREWKRNHASWSGLQLQPVFPVVFYTGTRPWEDFGSLADLVEQGALFRRHIPDMEPVFLNLWETDPADLIAKGKFFGRLLHIVQRARRPTVEFADVLRAEVGALEAMRPAERVRWLEFLSYLTALVYHERAPAERAPMRDVIETSVAAGTDRQEAQAMIRTIADELRDEGEKQGLERGRLQTAREYLLLVLAERFGKVPPPTRKAVKATTDLAQLRRWARRAATADNLTDIDFGPTAP